jgi:hypothetical protein
MLGHRVVQLRAGVVHIYSETDGLKVGSIESFLLEEPTDAPHGSEVELLKLRQLAVERTAEFKIHEYRQ